MSTNKSIIYKIRRNSDGLFSMGGSTPSFNKNGKIWKQKGHLTSHLSQLHRRLGTYRGMGNEHRHVYADCEVVVYEITEQPTDEFPVTDWIQTIKDRKDAEEQDRQLRITQAKDKEERKLYYKLKTKFENNNE